ncbi:unnamed protein product [Nezara viridula]|uniref:RRM domain-containing protein n=1 Tax=Nezara viridula TaxID=85310 RepID=A0A9P0HSQ5_NEZVI|nr:unnamed protein product [Nezara viridula]
MRDFAEGGGPRSSGGVRVYVGGLDGEIKKEDLEFAFEKFGKLNNVWVAYNPPGFAFVEFAEMRDAETACDNMNNTTLMGAQLRVEISRGRGRGGRGRGGGGRGSGGRGFGMRDEGRSGSFRGGSGGRGRGSGFGGGDRGGDRFGNKEGGGGGRYQGNGYSSVREPRFRSRSPHRFSGGSGGGGGGGSGGGRREFGGSGGGNSYGRGGFQRNSYSGSGGGY